MIAAFFDSHIAIIRDPVIRELPVTFDTREFMEQFIRYFEEDYISFLHHYRKHEAFRTVHRQIVEALVKHAEELSITTCGKTECRSILGECELVDQWRKTADNPRQ